MEKKLRSRAPNFTASDIRLLIDTVAKFKHIIENKKTDGATLQQKHAAWLDVVKIYNSSTTEYTRTLGSLQQTYKNLKKKAKKSACNAKMVIPGTRKLDSEKPSKQSVLEKFKTIANEKMELVVLQGELLKTQLENEKEKLAHNRRLRLMEMEEIKKNYEHNDIIRNLELEKYKK